VTGSSSMETQGAKNLVHAGGGEGVARRVGRSCARLHALARACSPPPAPRVPSRQGRRPPRWKASAPPATPPAVKVAAAGIPLRRPRRHNDTRDPLRRGSAHCAKVGPQALQRGPAAGRHVIRQRHQQILQRRDEAHAACAEAAGAGRHERRQRAGAGAAAALEGGRQGISRRRGGQVELEQGAAAACRVGGAAHGQAARQRLEAQHGAGVADLCRWGEGGAAEV
jgi:hypothetical protein